VLLLCLTSILQPVWLSWSRRYTIPPTITKRWQRTGVPLQSFQISGIIDNNNRYANTHRMREIIKTYNIYISISGYRSNKYGNTCIHQRNIFQWRMLTTTFKVKAVCKVLQTVNMIHAILYESQGNNLKFFTIKYKILYKTKCVYQQIYLTIRNINNWTWSEFSYKNFKSNKTKCV